MSDPGDGPAPSPKGGGFWHSLPGVLSGLAAVIAAVSGIIIAVRDTAPAETTKASAEQQEQPDAQQGGPDVTPRPEAANDDRGAPADPSPSPAGDPIVGDDAVGMVQQFTGDPSDTSPAVATTGGYANYVEVGDATGTITVEIPAAWSDFDDAPAGGFPPALAASTNLAAFFNSWRVPGVGIAADTNPAQFAAARNQVLSGPQTDCIPTAQQPYDDGVYTGTISLWNQCAGTGTSAITVIAPPTQNDVWVTVSILGLEQRDLEAAQVILESFDAG